jgi:hypothetical protein
VARFANQIQNCSLPTQWAPGGASRVAIPLTVLGVLPSFQPNSTNAARFAIMDSQNTTKRGPVQAYVDNIQFL